MKNTKCYIYTRVSTNIQVDGYSLEAQKEKLRKYAEFQEMTVVEEYSDEGKSGKNVGGRPDFQRMLMDIENGKDGVSFVLVFKLSRFGRNAADVLGSLQLMQDYGVNLICVEDGIDSSKDSGKLMISVLSAVAEIERENILIQTMAGRQQKAKEGKWNGGFAPYGYTLENGELKIAEDEAEVIKLIYDKYIHTNAGIAGITKYLNNNGYIKKKRQNNTTDVFTTHFVKGVLDNPVYCGKIAFGRRKTEKINGKRNEYHIVSQKDFPVYDGIHEAIVSETDWNVAFEKRKGSSTKFEKKHALEHEHILSGIVKCPICGAGLYGNVNRKKKDDGTYYKEYFYYSCKHRVRVGDDLCKYNRQWEENKVNAAVFEIISGIVKSSNFEQSIREKIEADIDTSSLENEISNLQKRLRLKQAVKEKIAEQIDNLDVTDKLYEIKNEDLQSRLNNLYDEIYEIEEQIAEVHSRIDYITQQKVTSDTVYKYLVCFDKLFEKFTEKEKKIFIQSFVERVELFEKELPNGKFLKSINFKFPVFYNGQEITGLSWDNKKTVETVVLLSRQNTN